MANVLRATLRIVLSIACLIVAVDFTAAAEPHSTVTVVPPSVLESSAAAPELPRPPDVDLSVTPFFSTAPASRFYGGVDYLLWWVKDSPLPIPLVLNGPRAQEDQGVGPLATTLYGGTPQGFPAFSGVRSTLGAWLDDGHVLGIEVRGLLLERQVAGFAARSDSTGSPLLQVPFYSTQPAGPSAPVPAENAFPFALPDALAGGLRITNSLRLWSSDVTGVVGLYRDASWEVSGLVGFKYLDLFESFDLNGDLAGVTSSPFQGESGVLSDHFQTRNQFYGGTLGARACYSSGPLSVEANGRVALGSSHEVLNIRGGFQAVNYNSKSGPEGIFAQPSNSGRHAADDFAVVPEAQIKVGYTPAAWMRVTVGYDFLYASSVARPGDQINRNLPKGQTFLQGTGAVSSTEPAPLFNKSDFFAHGLSFGLDFRY